MSLPQQSRQEAQASTQTCVRTRLEITDEGSFPAVYFPCMEYL
jgi:hypothetical protein